jgi:hypothetical protein
MAKQPVQFARPPEALTPTAQSPTVQPPVPPQLDAPIAYSEEASDYLKAEIFENLRCSSGQRRTVCHSPRLLHGPGL